MDNFEQSERSHALWMEYVDRLQQRSMPELTEADRKPSLGISRSGTMPGKRRNLLDYS